MPAGPEPKLKPPSIAEATVCANPFGKPFWLDRNKPTQRYLHDCLIGGYAYEQFTGRLIFDTLKPGDWFFDIGANCGWFSALAVAKGARVLAFEPDAENCKSLIRNVPEAMVVRAPVAEYGGSRDWYENLDNDGGHSLWACGAHPFNERTRAKAAEPKRMFSVALDSYTDYKPAVIKCDTEGAEVNVLLGAKELLKQPQLRVVILEKNEFGLAQMGHKPEEVVAIMTAAGFSDASEDKINWHWKR